MVKTADLFPTFTTTAEEAGQQGGQFDQSFGFSRIDLLSKIGRNAIF